MNEPQWERSRTRWREAPHDTRSLTWGMEVSGDAFVETCERHTGFSKDKSVLEIGPGYGRILTAVLERDVPFARYLGLDLSDETCSRLRMRFQGQENVEFVQGDVEKAAFDAPFDVVLSSLTFKHLFPSFEEALSNLTRGAAPGAIFCIDFPEAKEPWAEWNVGDTFVRYYTREELSDLFEKSGLEPVAFDEVRHHADPRWWRLLMVARKPG